MATEIERKFLVTSDAWRDGQSGVLLQQGYLSRDPDRTVRVRIAGEAAFLTIKGRSKGLTRSEFEYPLPLDEARELLALCLPPLIEKRRHEVLYGGHVWEIDEFSGDNAGLIVAELELPAEDTAFEAPPWLGREVSDDPRYFNSNLSQRPFTRW
jgi:CYTH domain-containing protein